MKMKNFIPFVIMTIYMFGLHAESSIIEHYHTLASQWLTERTDRIDNYLVDSNESERINRTMLELAYLGTYDSKNGFSNGIDFSFALDLPRFQKRMRLIFKKVQEDEWGSDGNISGNMENSHLPSSGSGISDSNESRSGYALGFEYFQWAEGKLTLKFEAGARFNDVMFEPYIGAKTGYQLYKEGPWESMLGNSLRLYLGGEVRDDVTLLTRYILDPKTSMGWYNTFGYSSVSESQSMGSELAWQKMLGEENYLKVGFALSGQMINFSEPEVSEYKIFGTYRNRVWKDWLYYEVTPATVWRKSDNFKNAYRLDLKLGIRFGGQ